VIAVAPVVDTIVARRTIGVIAAVAMLDISHIAATVALEVHKIVYDLTFIE
jgi:hypothetical protein